MTDKERQAWLNLIQPRSSTVLRNFLKEDMSPELHDMVTKELEAREVCLFEFAEEISEIIGGDRAYYRFEKQELIEMCKEMSESHRKVEEEIAGAV